MPRVHVHYGCKPEDLVNDVEFEFDQECLSDDSDELSDDRFDEETEIEIDNMECRSHMPSNELQELMPFDELQELMTPVTEDGCVRKQIIKPGIGVVVPENSIVIIHYDAFLEGQKLPFDSTRLRNRPRKFSLSDGNIIPILDIAIQTMKKGEISKCLVNFSYAYGERKNQKNARILYILELVAFFESKDALDLEEMSPEEQEKASFEKLIAVFHCEYQVANDILRNKNFKLAITRYRKMVRLLENVSVANEEEGKLRNVYLVKLYLNLCLAYSNIRNSEKAIKYGRSAITLDNNPKAMYRLGCAYLMADEFRKAKRYLLQAKQYQSFVSRVENALWELQLKEKQHQDSENVFCKRIFTNENTGKKFFSEVPEIKEFRSVIEREIKKFMKSELMELSFSSEYTDWQIETAKECASKHNLAFVTELHCGTKILKAVKK